MMRKLVFGLAICGGITGVISAEDVSGMKRSREISDGGAKDHTPTAVTKYAKLDESSSGGKIISDSDGDVKRVDSPIGSSSDEAERAVTKEFLPNLTRAVLEGAFEIEDLIEILSDGNLTFTTIDDAYWMFLRETADMFGIDSEMRDKISNLLATVKCRKQAGQVFSEQSLLDEYSNGAFGPFEMAGPFDEFEP